MSTFVHLQARARQLGWSLDYNDECEHDATVLPWLLLKPMGGYSTGKLADVIADIEQAEAIKS